MSECLPTLGWRQGARIVLQARKDGRKAFTPRPVCSQPVRGRAPNLGLGLHYSGGPTLLRAVRLSDRAPDQRFRHIPKEVRCALPGRGRTSSIGSPASRAVGASMRACILAMDSGRPVPTGSSVYGATELSGAACTGS